MRGPPPLRRLWLRLLPLLLLLLPPAPPAARAAAAGAAGDDGDVCARLRPGALDPRDQAAVDRLAAAVAERFGAAAGVAAPAELAAAEALLACHKALAPLFALASPGSALADGVAKALLRRGAPGAALAFLSARSPAAVPYAALAAARPALRARWAGAVFEAAVVLQRVAARYTGLFDGQGVLGGGRAGVGILGQRVHEVAHAVLRDRGFVLVAALLDAAAVAAVAPIPSSSLGSPAHGQRQLLNAVP